MSVEKSGDIEHIFKGVPEAKLKPKVLPEKNLETLRSDFVRLGINIDPSCRIANSTLTELVRFINSTLSPVEEFSEEEKLLLGGVAIGESGSRIAEDLIASEESHNFNIEINAGVTIGEYVKLASSVSIGENTQIGDGVEITTGTSVGKDCVIGRGVFLSNDCSVGDRTIIEDGTVFKPKTKIPKNSRVVHESGDSSMAKIESKLRIVK